MVADSAPSFARSFEEDWFLMVGEFLRALDVSRDMKEMAWRGICDAFDLWAPLSEDTLRFLQEGEHGLVLYLPGDPKICERFNSESRRFTPTVDFIESEAQKVRLLTRALGRRIWWDLLPEFDSSDHWWVDRPRPSGTREHAYQEWRDYYIRMNPLGRYLRQCPEERGFNLLACCGGSEATHYAYEMGVDLALLERNNDHVGDLSTGIAFVRGAARQYDRPWGIDISEWRDANRSPTQFDDEMRLTGGWSLSYHRRHLMISYMAGANMVRLESIPYFSQDGRPNPFTEVVQDVNEFARRHKDRGRPHVPIALMLDFHHGFSPKHGNWHWSKADAVWRGGIPYNEGDHMIDNFLKVAFPGHWLSGTTPGAPWSSPAEFRKMLAEGLDPRPYEPMGTTRWGDNLDIILSNASPQALQHYRTIVLLGEVRLEGDVKQRLRNWIEQGGRLVVSAEQVDLDDQELLGFRPWLGTAEGDQSLWLEDGTVYQEPAYAYTLVELSTAEALATSLQGDPLVTRNRIGAGELIVVTPRYLQSADGRCLLTIGQRLMDWLVESDAIAHVRGPALEYIVNQNAGGVVVSLINNSERVWQGSVLLPNPGTRYRTVEWLKDETLSHDELGTGVTVPVTIIPYDMKIVALESVE